ncbi:hypothetical protein RIF29_12703 [Crotalaria pallida]|uniref:Polyadenylate-binding protein n=1 Tax=Crotalaria pallida TaxID=3830 RepID=A0AAN9ING8_CROPI
MAQVQQETPITDSENQAGNPNQTTSLYVGDLDKDVTDSQLYDYFNQIVQVTSVRVCRDLATSQSLGYGYVNLNNPQDAAKALDELNFTPLNNKPIRIMYSIRDPTARKSNTANIFVKNLDKAIDHKALYDAFSSFGNILSCKIATDASGQSKGYGFVQFESEDSAQKAIDNINGKLINDKQVYVSHFLRKEDRESVLSSSNSKFTNLYVKNLSESLTEFDLKKIFGEYGTITSVVVMRNLDGSSKCFGFVNFENPDNAAKAVEALNGKKFDDKEWYVGKAMKKSERELELKESLDRSTKEAVDKYQGANLYVKNLGDSVGDEKLRELFSDFGTITSYKVMRDPHGISRGSGFVAFSTPEEANRALGEMNGKMVAGKPLFVALAERKEERRAKLQAQFSQMRPVVIAPPVASHMPLYPPRAPALGPQFMYGQPPPAIIPQMQAGFSYQQLVPGMRPGGAPLPNYFVPLVQQGQQGPRSGGRRGSGSMQQPQHPLPMMHQQMLPRGPVYRYPSGRNMRDVPQPGVAGGMPIQATQALATALANAPPEQQRTMLGEALYPLVDKLEHESAAKVTGMILEMDQPEVLHLIESPDALKEKVAEAMNLLRNVAPEDQLASLSLNDNPAY